LLEGNWDPSQHPRAPQGQSDGGQWIAKGGASFAGSAFIPSSPIRTAAFHPAQATAHLAALGGAQSSTWPTTGSASSWLPKVGSGAGAGAAAAVGIGAGGFLGALRNGSMGMYWARMPGVQAMPRIWVYELEKRVQAGKLSREDAIGIFNTAVLGAEAQGFKPTGDTMSAVHKSAVDFLGQAEAVYFAKRSKKKAAPEPASLPGAYRQSGGRVFPTERNSGLTGDALHKEQEKFCERGLAQGKSPGELRGQASVAGLGRGGGTKQPDHIEDPEAEAALQRAIRRTNK
jgi:hypothetical protein